MLMLYDLFLLDDDICIRELYNRRRRQLRSMIRYILSRLNINTRIKINFESRKITNRLRQFFVVTIV